MNTNICDSACVYCTRYEEEPLLITAQRSVEDEDYVKHVSARVMKRAVEISDPREKSLFIIKYYNFMLANTFFMKKNMLFARELLIMLKCGHMSQEVFQETLETYGFDGDELTERLETTVQVAFSGWGHHVFSCREGCEHCCRYIESEHDVIENYLFGEKHEFINEVVYENSGDEYVEHVCKRMIDLSAQQTKPADGFMMIMVAADFLLNNGEYLVSHPAEKNAMISMLEYISRNYSIAPNFSNRLDPEFDMEEFIDLFKTVM